MATNKWPRGVRQSIPPIEPVVLAYGPRAPYDDVDLAPARLSRVATVADARARVLCDRNVVATVVAERTYAAADAVLEGHRSHVARVPTIVALTEEWPRKSRWRPSLGVHHVETERMTQELPRVVDRILARALQRFRGIEQYGLGIPLSPAETDVLWQWERGVPRGLLELAQGVTYDTRKQRLAYVKRKTGLDIELAWAEAVGDLAAAP